MNEGSPPHKPTELARCLAFDAYGTVLRPDPPASTVYWQVGQRYGVSLDPKTVRRRLHRAFQAIEESDRKERLQTSEQRERERWRAIVHAVFRECPFELRDALFEELFEYFASGRAWALYDDARTSLPLLKKEGKTLVLASNLDRRLHRVVHELGIEHLFDAVVISSEVGWRKPAKQFFVAVAASVRCKPSEVLYVGDDYENDYRGAEAAGMVAVLLDRKQACHQSPTPRCIPSLECLLAPRRHGSVFAAE